ncbi:MAG: hypothetical protein JJT85_09125 [Chromatiales bacterium]|nr:hypothetical protein [Chromatiales bacterium]
MKNARLPGAAATSLLALSACGPLPGPEGPLALEINELCTTCVDYLRCDPAQDEDGGVTLYVLEQKTFVQQVATIGHYFMQYINPRTVDRRGVTVLSRAGYSAPPAQEQGQAEQDLVEFVLRLPGARVDLYTGRWYGPDDMLLGSCRILPRNEGRELSAALSGGS